MKKINYELLFKLCEEHNISIRYATNGEKPGLYIGDGDGGTRKVSINDIVDTNEWSKEDYLTHLNYGVKTCPAIYDAFENLIYKYYDLVEKYDKCERALDKACKQLTHAYPFGVNKCETDAWDDSWKEWAFKNDER